jgi:PAS domain S-box-containing protein
LKKDNPLQDELNWSDHPLSAETPAGAAEEAEADRPWQIPGNGGGGNAEEAQRGNERMYRLLTEAMTDIVWTFDAALRPQYVSPSVFRVLGFTPEERLRQPIREMLTAESFARMEALIAFEMDRDGQSGVDPARSVTIELEYYRKGGSTVWLENVVSALRDAEGRITGIHGSSRDISERRRAVEELRQNEEKIRFLFDHMREGVAFHQMIYDGQGRATDYRVMEVNPAFEKHTGIPARLAQGRSGRQLYGLPDPPCLDIYAGVARTGSSAFFETFFPSLNRYFEISVFSPRQGWFATVFSDVSERQKMELTLRQSYVQLRKILGATVQAMAVTVETRDPYTAGHQRRVADLARCMAQEMGLDAEEIDGVHMAAMIHDIGKICVPAEILSKPATLIPLEARLIQIHAQAGYDIIKDIDFPWPIARIVLEHHERIDGSGYPNGLTGDQVLAGSRVLAVADVVEAIASHRPHRPSLGIAAALAEVARGRGSLYDPEAIDACESLLTRKGYAFRTDPHPGCVSAPPSPLLPVC